MDELLWRAVEIPLKERRAEYKLVCVGLHTWNWTIISRNQRILIYSIKTYYKNMPCEGAQLPTLKAAVQPDNKTPQHVCLLSTLKCICRNFEMKKRKEKRARAFLPPLFKTK